MISSGGRDRALSIRNKNLLEVFKAEEFPIAEFEHRVTEIVISRDSLAVFISVCKGKVVKYSLDPPKLLASSDNSNPNTRV